MNQSPEQSRRLGVSEPFTLVQWLVCIIAAIGFMFDTYVLLLNPLILRPALRDLLHVDPTTAAGSDIVLHWTGYVMWGSALCGGVFGMLGGYLTDRLGRRKLFFITLALYLAATAATALSWNLASFMLFRFLTVMPAFVVIGMWFLFQIINSFGALGDKTGGGIAYGAHVGGFLAGMVLISFSVALRSTANARSPASRNSGLVSSGMPASNIAE